MRVATLHAYGQPLRLEERPDPQPGPGEVTVEVGACGVCGSDLFLSKGGFDSTLPIVPGHEVAGTVHAIGEGVDPDLRGQTVAVYYIVHCGRCRFCCVGRPNLCLQVQRLGVEFDGGFAQRLVVPAANAIPAGHDIPMADLAVLTDAVATPYHALHVVARVQAGETVIVFGVGGIGSNAVQLAARVGCRVIAVSRRPSSLELARELGAETTVVGGDDAVAAVRALTGPSGPEVVVQTVGSATIDEQAVATVGLGGRVILVGASTERFGVRDVDLIWREASVHGSRGYTPADLRAVLNLYRGGEITTAHLTRRLRPLNEVNEALADLSDGAILRTVLTP